LLRPGGPQVIVHCSKERVRVDEVYVVVQLGPNQFWSERRACSARNYVSLHWGHMRDTPASYNTRKYAPLNMATHLNMLSLDFDRANVCMELHNSCSSIVLVFLTWDSLFSKPSSFNDSDSVYTMHGYAFIFGIHGPLYLQWVSPCKLLKTCWGWTVPS
jgi:hypothetical protein